VGVARGEGGGEPAAEESGRKGRTIGFAREAPASSTSWLGGWYPAPSSVIRYSSVGSIRVWLVKPTLSPSARTARCSGYVTSRYSMAISSSPRRRDALRARTDVTAALFRVIGFSRSSEGRHQHRECHLLARG